VKTIHSEVILTAVKQLKNSVCDKNTLQEFQHEAQLVSKLMKTA
jgi:hypothetical protein